MPPDTPATGGLDRFEAWFVALADQALTGPVLISAIAVAVAAGALHALGPGHGKTIMAAYLAGTDGRVGAAATVGAIVAAMHTLSAVVLGGVLFALVGSGEAVLGLAVPLMSLSAGVLVMSVGGVLAHRQVRRRRRAQLVSSPASASGARRHHDGPSDDQHGHHHPDDHHGHRPGDATAAGHAHDHHHALPEGVSPVSPRGLAAIGLAGGLLPSPASFLVLATAIFTGRALLGFGLVLAFGAGLAATLTGVGVLTIKGRGLLVDRAAQVPRMAWLAQRLPLLSSFALVGAGLWVTVISLLRL